MTTLNDWFFLKGGRRSFKPQPLQDKAVMFCHQDVHDSIRHAIEKAYALGETLKLLLWGDWGIGKTHTLRHIEFWFCEHADSYPARTIFVEIGDVAKSSNFSVIHKDLLDGIGLETVIELVFAYMRTGKLLLDELDRIGIPPTIRNAINKLFVAVPGQAPPDIVTTAWNYLRGENVGSRGEALGLRGQLSDGKEFYYVLAALGHIVHHVEKRQLIFLVDEASKLEAVSEVQQMERHWVNVNKLIFDQENIHFGFIYTVSGKGATDLPPALFEPQIENRLGNRRLELRNLAPQSVRDFLSNLTDAFVDKDAAAASGEIPPLAQPELYPFEPDAFERFVEYFHRSQENSKPRDIADRLDDAAFYALKGNKRLIDEAILDQINM